MLERRILRCNGTETPRPSRARASWDQEGPSGDTGREEPRSQAKPRRLRQLSWLSSPPYHVCASWHGTADVVVLWSTLISPGEAFIAALER